MEELLFTDVHDIVNYFQQQFKPLGKISVTLTPVALSGPLLPTTRVNHAYASIELPENYAPKQYEGFIKDSKKWVIFPRLSYINHGMIENRNVEIGEDFSKSRYNIVEGKECKSSSLYSNTCSS